MGNGMQKQRSGLKHEEDTETLIHDFINSNKLASSWNVVL
ncbi:unnamed protein product [Linum tenue]|uniref:Uncharacterized protein n=1 Tax=Linum tenue TaxID=586396 RepID=A0AAV0JWE0_9ROSI|nr:unnamed protein product [Linum tenue]